MKEFMLYILKKTNSEQTLLEDRHMEFLKACETLIGELKQEGRLIAAKPIQWEGVILSNSNGEWKTDAYNSKGEVIGGYYHIKATDLNDAISVAKRNPEFVFNPDTRIEVRPVKTKESSTAFDYPDATNS